MQKVVMSSHRTESKKRGIIGEKYLNGTEMKQEDFGEKKKADCAADRHRI